MLKETIYNLKTQPVMGVVSVLGTALCLLLVMMVTVLNDIDTAPLAPESNRDRLLYDHYICIYNNDQSQSGGVGQLTIDRLYSNLPSAEAVSVAGQMFTSTDIETDGVAPVIADRRDADGNYWKIFDHQFVAGGPLTDDDVNTRNNVVVIAESVAGKLFGSGEAVGKTVRIGYKEYVVKGVVRDVSPVMGASYAQMWVPIKPMRNFDDGEDGGISAKDWRGNYMAIIMAKTPADVDNVIREAHARIPAMQKEMEATTDGMQRRNAEIYPSQQKEYIGRITNGEEYDHSEHEMMNYILIAIFLIVPAINLSSMTQGRLSKRRHEIGVRRAFGARRSEIFASILGENLIVTLAGGLIGLAVTGIFLWLFADTLIDVPLWQTSVAKMSVTPAMFFRWNVFGWALLFCFVLNLLSAGIPSWRASREDPVHALNSRQ